MGETKELVPCTRIDISGIRVEDYKYLVHARTHAKSKDNLGCISAKHVIHESAVVGENIGSRTITAIA